MNHRTLKAGAGQARRLRIVLAAVCVAGWLAAAMPSAAADKVPDLGKTKFKDIAKYLSLTSDQQQKIKGDVERIQDIVKDAEKQRGTAGFGAGGRTPVGAGRWGGPASGGNQGSIRAGDVEGQRLQREEWQKEINNRVTEIRSFLTPGQLEKFKTLQVPDIRSSPMR